MLATEFERRTSAYQKAPSGVMQVWKDLVAVNLGLMWAEAGSPLLVEAQSKARALWTGVHRKWTGHRTQKGYQAHQLLIQEQFARNGGSSPHAAHRFVAISAMDLEVGDTVSGWAPGVRH